MDFDIGIKPFFPQAECASYRRVLHEGEFLVIQIIGIEEGTVLTIEIFYDGRKVRLEDGRLAEEYQIRKLLLQNILQHKNSGLYPLNVPGQSGECFTWQCFS